MTDKIKSAKTYQWVIGILVSALIFFSGWMVKPSVSDTTARQLIAQTQRDMAYKDSELESRIKVLEMIAQANRDNITYIRAQTDEIKSLLMEK